MPANPLKGLLHQQCQWAASVGKSVDEKHYVLTVEDNLQQPLSASALAAFQEGQGGELVDGPQSPAKMRALRSSSALCVNVFDHWSTRPSKALLSAMGLDEAAEPIRFEAKFHTKLSQTSSINPPPHLDVAVRLRSGTTVGVESKFTEWLSCRQREDRKAPEKQSFLKYLVDGKRLWSDQDLPRCQALVESIHSGAEHFSYLNGPQLLKHALGLNRPGFRGGCLVKVKRPRRRFCRVGCSSLPQPRRAGYSRWMSAGAYG